MRALRNFIIVAAALFGMSQGAWAAVDCAAIERKSAGEPALGRIAKLTLACLGGASDEHPLARRFRRDVPDAAEGQARRSGTQERRYIVLDQLSELEAAAREAGQERAAHPAERMLLERLAGNIARAKRAVESPSSADREMRHPEQWDWDGSHGFPPVQDLPLIENLLRPQCAVADSQACERAYEVGKEVVRIGELTRRILQYNTLDVLEVVQAEAERRRTKWNSYFNDARMQYLHELKLNGLIWAHVAKGQRGFADAPASQIILLHPGVALDYRANGGLKPAVLLEVIGYNRWSYDSANKVSGGLGASVVRAFSERSGSGRGATGIMVHVLQRYSFGITRQDGRTGWLLSADLAHLLWKPSESLQGEVRFARPLFD